MSADRTAEHGHTVFFDTWHIVRRTMADDPARTPLLHVQRRVDGQPERVGVRMQREPGSLTLYASLPTSPDGHVYRVVEEEGAVFDDDGSDGLLFDEHGPWSHHIPPEASLLVHCGRRTKAELTTEIFSVTPDHARIDGLIPAGHSLYAEISTGHSGEADSVDVTVTRTGEDTPFARYILAPADSGVEIRLLKDEFTAPIEGGPDQLSMEFRGQGFVDVRVFDSLQHTISRFHVFIDSPDRWERRSFDGRVGPQPKLSYLDDLGRILILARSGIHKRHWRLPINRQYSSNHAEYPGAADEPLFERGRS